MKEIQEKTGIDEIVEKREIVCSVLNCYNNKCNFLGNYGIDCPVINNGVKMERIRELNLQIRNIRSVIGQKIYRLVDKIFTKDEYVELQKRFCIEDQFKIEIKIYCPYWEKTIIDLCD